MPLLRNNDTRIHHRCHRTTIVWAAIQGPFKRPLDTEALLSYVLGAGIVLAIVVACLDITIWRP